MQDESRFALNEYLRADLQRYAELLDGTSRSGARLWLGALSPRFMPVLLCRLSHWAYLRRLGPLAKIWSLTNFVFFGIEIAIRCPIGKGLFLPHTQGTVIGAARIGEYAIIYQGVTLGAKELDFGYDPLRRPTLADRVSVGSGAKVLGGISLGDDVRIGANSVVLESIPAGSLAVGSPARVVRSSPHVQ